jgi:hypothetical protein
MSGLLQVAGAVFPISNGSAGPQAAKAVSPKGAAEFARVGVVSRGSGISYKLPKIPKVRLLESLNKRGLPTQSLIGDGFPSWRS